MSRFDTESPPAEATISKEKIIQNPPPAPKKTRREDVYHVTSRSRQTLTFPCPSSSDMDNDEDDDLPIEQLLPRFNITHISKSMSPSISPAKFDRRVSPTCSTPRYHFRPVEEEEITGKPSPTNFLARPSLRKRDYGR
jgi:hypothetical protein